MGFKENLIRYREIAGYSNAADFARKLGIPYTTYMGYENKGAWPPEKNLLKIAEFLNVSIDELIGHKPQLKPIQDAMIKARCMGLAFKDLGTGLKLIELKQHDKIHSISYNDFINLVNAANEQNVIATQNFVKQSFNIIFQKLLLNSEIDKLLATDTQNKRMLVKGIKFDNDTYTDYVRSDFNSQVLAHDENVARKRNSKRKKAGDK